MAEDILHLLRTTTRNPGLEFNVEIYNKTLTSKEDLFLMGSGIIMGELKMSAPNRPTHDAFNRKFERERQYDLDALSQSVQTKVPIFE